MTGQSDNQRKVLYLITQGEMGGAQKYVLDLSIHLPEGFQAVVAIGQGPSELKDGLEKRNVAVFELKHLIREINPIQDLKALAEIKALIKKTKPELIHLNSSKAGFLGSLAAKQLNFKNVVFTAHGFAFLEPQNFPKKLIYLEAERAAKTWRKKIITVSEFDRNAALTARVGKEEQLVTVHNGMDFNKIELLERSTAREFIINKINQSNDYKLIGTIANLYETKGLDYLIEAAAKVVNENGRVKFVVIGEGRERKKLESRIKNHGLKNNFFLIGSIPNAARYLKAFDIFVLPSIKEGLPYTILEAANASLPIVATRTGGISEVLEDKKSGLLVSVKDSKKLAESIKLLIDDRGLANNLATEARKVTEQFSLEKMIKKTIEVYRECLRE